jgi:hypothetical protein
MIAIYKSGYAVFGIGATLAEALADANEWLDPKERITEDDVAWSAGHGEVDGKMSWSYATDRLVAKVLERGGAFAHEHDPSGHLDVAA